MRMKFKILVLLSVLRISTFANSYWNSNDKETNEKIQ